MMLCLKSVIWFSNGVSINSKETFSNAVSDCNWNNLQPKLSTMYSKYSSLSISESEKSESSSINLTSWAELSVFSISDPVSVSEFSWILLLISFLFLQHNKSKLLFSRCEICIKLVYTVWMFSAKHFLKFTIFNPETETARLSATPSCPGYKQDWQLTMTLFNVMPCVLWKHKPPLLEAVFV